MMHSANQNKQENFFKPVHGKSLILLAMLLYAAACFPQGLVDYVQPLSGTAPSTTISALKHSEAGGTEQNANTIPAVGLPFGMTQWVAQTRTSETKCIPPYLYRDSLLSGFRGTHWISGSCMQDYGSVTIMPVAGRLHTQSNDYAIPFSHDQEITGPHYYKLNTEKFAAEITASLRCGMMQFTMNRDDSLYLLIIPNSDYGKGFVKTDKVHGVIYGFNPVHRIYQGWGQPAGFSGWFYIKFNRLMGSNGTFSEGEMFFTDSLENKSNMGAYAGFSMKKGERITLNIGTSFSSLEGAKNNLEKEIGNRTFDDIQSAAKQTWENALSKITVQTADEKAKRIFYTAMYHAWQHPRLYNDADGTYPKFSGNYELMKAGSRNYYDDFSMWDIYRAQLPLIELIDPGKINDFVQSIISKGKQGGWLPVFPCWNSYTAAMIGDHATAFIASAYNKGIRNYDVKEAYRLMRKNAFTMADKIDYENGMGRRALNSYMHFNFIPMEDSVPHAFHKKEQVSRTLEYAYDDYALSVVANALKMKEDYEKLRLRSLNFKNVFDTTAGMVRGRHGNGQWVTPFHPDKREVYITEGTPRQYTFYIPHGVEELISLLGGKRKLEDSLDSLFLKNEYWHGNEPGHQIPFLYNYTDSPWKTQKTVHSILNEEYSDGPGGLSGNDDAGQMSAWYVFAAIGFYPVNPVSGKFQLCSPLFDRVSIQVPGNKKFEIICHRDSAQDKFIKSMKLNGKTYQKYFIRYNDIIKGGMLEIRLGKNQ